MRPDGSFLAATAKGLTLFEGTRVRSIGVFHGLPNNHVYALADWGEKTAAGTLGGLAILEGLRVVGTKTMDDSPLRHNWVSALAVLGDTLFAGTFGGGAVAFSAAGPDPMKGPLDRVDVNQNAALVCGGRLWVGTYGRGLWVYDPGLKQWSRPRARLSSENVAALAAWQDAGGREILAAATDAGLDLVDPNGPMQ
jgi:hypothetical protein